MPGAQDISERFMTALASGDVETLRATTTDGFYWYWSSTLPMGGVTRGLDKVLEMFAGADRLYAPGSRTTAVARRGFGDDFAVYELEVSGRTAKGRDYFNRFLMLIETEAGKVSGVREYNDTQRVAEFLFEDRALSDPTTTTYVR